MRKIIVVALSLMCCYSCELTNQQKAENSIKEYLKDRLDDPTSYESVEFGELKPVYEDFKSASTDNLKIVEQREWSKKQLQKWELNETAPSLIKLPINNIRDSVDYYKKLTKVADSIYYKKEAEYINSNDRIQVGWSMSHNFRANNKFGAKVKNKLYFFFQMDFSIKEVL